MDINNYSYAPHILDGDNTYLYYENDDLYVEITKERAYNYYIFWIYATSYDGQLEYSGRTKSENVAKEVFDYIVDNYATTPPAGDIDNYIAKIINAEED